MAAQREVVGFLDGGRGAHMIKMSVGGQQGLQLAAAVADRGQQPVGLFTRVDQDGFFSRRPLAGQQNRIHLQRPHGHDFQVPIHVDLFRLPFGEAKAGRVFKRPAPKSAGPAVSFRDYVSERQPSKYSRPRCVMTSSPIIQRKVFLSLVCWMKRSCSAFKPSGVTGLLK